MNTRTMTLNLTVPEMERLAALSERKRLSKTTVMRQALKVYDEIDAELESGKKLLLQDKESASQSPVMILF